MSKEKESQEELFRVRADSSGVDLTVKKGVPDLLARLIPPKYRFRRGVDETIGDQLIEKIKKGGSLDDAEFAFAEDLFSGHAKKFLRLKSIEQRAQVLIEEQRVPLLEGHAPREADGAKTSDDWVSKFREDASLVDDELIREIYARVLSEEHQAPGAFSLRALGVLRYLDHEAAIAFGKLQKVLVGGFFVPCQSPHMNSVLKKVGLNHEQMLMLNDAGLVYSANESKLERGGEVLFFRLTGHSSVVSARSNDNSQVRAAISVHALTPAGKQLTRIAECEPDEQALTALLEWLRSNFQKAKLEIAELPSPNWEGPADQLTWRLLNEEAAK